MAKIEMRKKKYEVLGHATVICSMIVYANSEEEAIEKANNEFGGLTSYAGMGGTDKLLGVLSSDSDRAVLPDTDVEFDEAIEQ